MTTQKVYAVIPNWNGGQSLSGCIDSLLAQTQRAEVVVVDNASTDNSVDFIQKKYPQIILLRHDRNLGFAGGVNAGIKRAIKDGVKYVALFNNDAVADKGWLEHLVNFLESHADTGIVTGKIMTSDKKHFDSTGDLYTIWGLPFPRGRGEPVSPTYDERVWVFGASGGASLYRVEMLNQIGLFDEDFFAYYEDVDLSFRAQLAGWKVAFEAKALAYHEIGASGNQIKDFYTYQTLKNYPMLLVKNVPARLWPTIQPRFELAYWAFFYSAMRRGQGWTALRAYSKAWLLMPRKFAERRKIQKNRRVSVDYINSIITHDLPPNAYKLRALRSRWWRLLGKAGS